MLFPKSLKNPCTPEEFIEMLRKEQWTGGDFKIVKPESLAGALGMAYIVFANPEDPRYAVSVACFSTKFNKVNSVKATVMDITGFDQQVTDSLKYSAARRAGGSLGAMVMNVASGDAAKQKNAKALAKATDKELLAFLAKYGL